MKRQHPILCFLVICCAVLFAIPAGAIAIFDNGPPVGSLNGLDIIAGGLLFVDGFIPGPESLNLPMTGMTLGVWLDPGDFLQSVQVTIWLQPDATQQYYSGVLGNFTQSTCFPNFAGYSVCDETGQLTTAGPTFANLLAVYWLELSNATTKNNGSAKWDVNNGKGCKGYQCPAQMEIVGERPFLSESFQINSDLGLTPSPEPGSLLLLGTGVFGLAGAVRRKMQTGNVSR